LIQALDFKFYMQITMMRESSLKCPFQRAGDGESLVRGLKLKFSAKLPAEFPYGIVGEAGFRPLKRRGYSL